MYHSLSIVPVGALTHLGAMALQRAVYLPRDAEDTVLHPIVAEHLEAFLEAVAEAGDGVGLVEHGVARFRCEGCPPEHLVPLFRVKAAGGVRAVAAGYA